MFEACAGCRAEFAPHDGPTHEYIGAHPGCWALYAAVIGSGVPSADLLGASRAHVRALAPSADLPSDALAPLLIDAYAAQHHGVPSAQAMQSVAVHLLVLHGVVERGFAVERALWIRRRAVRVRGVYRWLEPPPRDAAHSLRELWPDDARAWRVSPAAYITSVLAAWRDRHNDALVDWFARYVEADAPRAPQDAR